MSPHAELYLQRARLSPSDPRQAELAPREHGAFAQQWTYQNPLVAVPSLMAAIPAYTAYKGLAELLGRPVARSPASLSEMTEAYKGVGKGLLARLLASRFQ